MTISGEPPEDKDNDKKNYIHRQVEQQLQTILNLFNSGIPSETIADQVDIDKNEVDQLIQDIKRQEERKRILLEEQVSNNPSLGSTFYLDAVVDIEQAIKNAETRIWKALKSEPEFTISTEETKGILKKLAKSKVPMVILHVDLVGSTRLSMSVPLDRLTKIMQAFTHEMSILVNMYGGYVLKYIGDAVIGFFVPGGTLHSTNDYNLPDIKDGFDEKLNSKNENSSSLGNLEMNEDNYFLSCINAIDCGRSMVRIILQGINPILNQFDYPELGVRIGIDLGENAIIQYGFDVHKCDHEKLVKEPHYDILGHTINMAVKMTSLASPNRIVIGQSVYRKLIDKKERSKFKILKVRPSSWTYVDESSGKMYSLFTDISTVK
jgi:class 3 adenylate cyclase